MNNTDKEVLKKMLLTNRSNIEGIIKKMKENGTANQSEHHPVELSNYDNHPAEIATELFQVELNNALMVHEEHLLWEINHALEKIDKGTYGKCELCGKQIIKERLEAIPYARVCKECEENKAIDPEILANTRPNEELVLDAPVGRKYQNQREDDEHEGMDQLFDLVKYGSSDSPQDMGGYYDYEEYYTNEIDKQGIVDKMDQFSNQQYKRQLPD
ncbi:MAG: TraR/DksA C4-type zinc finger protein [Acetivibrionales bacterium]